MDEIDFCEDVTEAVNPVIPDPACKYSNKLCSLKPNNHKQHKVTQDLVLHEKYEALLLKKEILKSQKRKLELLEKKVKVSEYTQPKPNSGQPTIFVVSPGCFWCLHWTYMSSHVCDKSNPFVVTCSNYVRRTSRSKKPMSCLEAGHILSNCLKITIFCFSLAAMSVKCEIPVKIEFSQFFKGNTCAQLQWRTKILGTVT